MKTSIDSKKRMFIESVAFIEGAAVLVLEIAGARLLAPAFGSSIFVWTAQICTVLVALAAGYWYGGKRSEGKEGMAGAARMLFGACATLAAALFLSDILLALSTLFGAKIGPFVFSAFLFFLPCFFAGALTPILLRMYVGELDEVGNDAGKLYAISTLGSLAGALLSAYAIVPFIGAKAGILMTAAAFGLLGFAAAREKKLHAVAALALLLISSYSLAQRSNIFVPEGFEVKQSYDSEYFHFRIIENSTHRLLLLDADAHSMQEIGKAGTGFTYTEWMANAAEGYFASAGWTPSDKRVGMVGLGAGSIASRFAQQGYVVDAFEIDPQVYKVAVDEFGLQDYGRMEVHIGDARASLQERDYSFDVLFVDAFASKFSIPFHLATSEAFKEYAKAVSGDGLIIINIISAEEGPRSEMFRSVSSTAREAFPHQVAIYGGDATSVQNVILIGSKKPISPSLAAAFGKNAVVAAAWEEGPILTDEKSTADYAMMKVLG